MQIDYDILITYGAVARKYDKGEIVFHEGAMPHFYYQVVEGAVKMFSSNAAGRELTQGLFNEGQSFGEPALLLGRAYPGTAQTTMPAVLVKISKEKWLSILQDYPEIANRLLYTFAERIYQKANALRVWVCHSPEEKIFQFLRNTKGEAEVQKYCVPFTRQQIADFTGLRVETVIRTLIRMNKQGKLSIVDHKIYF